MCIKYFSKKKEGCPTKQRDTGKPEHIRSKKSKVTEITQTKIQKSEITHKKPRTHLNPIDRRLHVRVLVRLHVDHARNHQIREGTGDQQSVGGRAFLAVGKALHQCEQDVFFLARVALDHEEFRVAQRGLARLLAGGSENTQREKNRGDERKSVEKQ